MISILNLLLIPFWNLLREKLRDVLNSRTQLVVEGIIGLIVLVAFNLYFHQDLNLVWTDHIVGARWGLEISFLETALSGILFLLFLQIGSLRINFKNAFLALFFFIAFAAPSFLQFLTGTLLFAGLILESGKDKKLIYTNIIVFSTLEIVRVSLAQRMNIVVNEFVAVLQVVITTIALSYLLRFLQKKQNHLYQSSIALVLIVIFFEKFLGELPQGPLLDTTLSLLIVLSFIYLSFKAFLINRSNSLEELFLEAAFIFFLFSLRFSDLSLFAVYLGGQTLVYHIYKALNPSETSRLRQLTSLLLKLFLVGFPGSVLFLSSLAFIGFVHVGSIELGIVFLTIISIRTAYNCANLIIQEKSLLEKEKWEKNDFWLVPIIIALYNFSFLLVPNSLFASTFKITEYSQVLKLQDPSLVIQVYYLLLTLAVGLAFFFFVIKSSLRKKTSKKVFLTVFDNLPDQILNSENGVFTFFAISVGKLKKMLAFFLASIASTLLFSMNESVWVYQSSNRLKIKLAIVLVFSATISTLYLLRVL